ncbi:MAG: hypothetical protein ACLFVP_02945 [Candidatus Bathyarchaeia archaeon]
MSSYSTISVPVEVKKILDEARGNREWGEYLLDLYKEAEISKRTAAFQRLIDLLDEEDLQRLEESSREFREEFVLR